MLRVRVEPQYTILQTAIVGCYGLKPVLSTATLSTKIWLVSLLFLSFHFCYCVCETCILYATRNSKNIATKLFIILGDYLQGRQSSLLHTVLLFFRVHKIDNHFVLYSNHNKETGSPIYIMREPTETCRTTQKVRVGIFKQLYCHHYFPEILWEILTHLLY